MMMMIGCITLIALWMANYKLEAIIGGIWIVPLIVSVGWEARTLSRNQSQSKDQTTQTTDNED